MRLSYVVEKYDSASFIQIVTASLVNTVFSEWHLNFAISDMFLYFIRFANQFYKSY